jgi:hypothetical protein
MLSSNMPLISNEAFFTILFNSIQFYSDFNYSVLLAHQQSVVTRCKQPSRTGIRGISESPFPPRKLCIAGSFLISSKRKLVSSALQSQSHNIDAGPSALSQSYG